MASRRPQGRSGSRPCTTILMALSASLHTSGQPLSPPSTMGRDMPVESATRVCPPRGAEPQSQWKWQVRAPRAEELAVPERRQEAHTCPLPARPLRALTGGRCGPLPVRLSAPWTHQSAVGVGELSPMDHEGREDASPPPQSSQPPGPHPQSPYSCPADCDPQEKVTASTPPTFFHFQPPLIPHEWDENWTWNSHRHESNPAVSYRAALSATDLHLFPGVWGFKKKNKNKKLRQFWPM